MEPLRTHNINAEELNIPRDARTLSVCFAGYDRDKGRDDLVYVSVNTYWQNVHITLPKINAHGNWHLAVNTYGDGHGRYFYPEGQEIRIDGEFVMRPRSVAVFTVR